MKILIVKLSAIGDVIHTLPALNALRQAYPQAHIAWLVEEAAHSLIEGHSALDRILVSRRKTWLQQLKTPLRRQAWREIKTFVNELRDTQYDLIIDFQGLLKSAMLIALARGKVKAGFGKGLEHAEHSYLFLNRRIPAVSMEHHALRRSLLLLNGLGINPREITYHLPISAADRDQALRLLAEAEIVNQRPLIAINPVARWKTKLWSEERFAALADSLIENNQANLFFTGSREDQEVIDRIQARMKATAASFAGRTSLKTLAALYQQVDALISTDTGPMHLGAAVGVPVVALFGPTAPHRTGPYGKQHRIVQGNLSCSPCFNRNCPTMACMQAIQVADVIAGLKQAGVISGT